MQSNIKTRPRKSGTVFLCVYGMESSSPPKPVHYSQTDAFRGKNLTEDHFHMLFIQPAQDIEQPVGCFRGRSGRTDVMRIAFRKQLQMFGKTEYTAFSPLGSLLAEKFFQEGNHPVLGAVNQGD